MILLDVHSKLQTVLRDTLVPDHKSLWAIRSKDLLAE